MRYLFDTEFLETAYQGVVTIQLISIGVVSDDGRELYLENRDFDWEQLMPDEWHRENVQPHLAGPGHDSWQSPAEMASSLRAFTVDDSAVKWFAWVGAYDYVALMSLFGRLIDRPSNWPIFCHELKQVAESAGMRKDQRPEMTGHEHNALDDARWNLAVIKRCDQLRLKYSVY